MYNYEWDIETGGYILLPTKITGVTKECKEVTLLFYNNRLTLNDSGGGVDNKIKEGYIKLLKFK